MVYFGACANAILHLSWHNMLFVLTDLLVLDNTFSWTRSKDVYYSVEVQHTSSDGKLADEDQGSFSSALDQLSLEDTSADLVESAAASK